MDNRLQELLCVGKLEEAAGVGTALYETNSSDIQLAVRTALIYLRLGQSKKALHILTSASDYAGEFAEMPKIAQIEITRKCNLSCAMCPRTRSLSRSLDSDDRGRLNDFWNREMTYDQYQYLIEDNPFFDSIIFHGIGEPLIHPNFIKMIQLHRETSPVETSFFTNGVLLNADLCQTLIDNKISLITFSIDARNPKLFTKIRAKGKLPNVIRNIQQLQIFKAEKQSVLPQIAFHITLRKENYDQIFEIIDLAKTLQVAEINISAIEPSDELIINYQHSPYEFIKDVEKWKDLAQINGQKLNFTGFELKYFGKQNHNVQKGFCLWLWMGVYISVEGIVLPCCHLTDIRHYALGNIHTESLSNIWNNTKYQSMRAGIIMGKPVFENCLKCPYYLTKT
jgi:radical SAM protein with 4Fe4S-binding SPASM domain